MSDIFGSGPKKKPAEAPQVGLRPLTREEVQNIVRNAAMNAVEFIEEEIAPKRKEADQYYQGYSAVKKKKGRSQVTVTKVRDGVKSVVPSVARIFTQTDTIVEFYSDNEEDEKICEDQTKFCNDVYHKNNGFRALISATVDCLKAKVGVVKVTLEKVNVAVHRGMKAVADVSEDELASIVGDGQITEMSGQPPKPTDDPLAPAPALSAEQEVVVTRSNSRNKWTLAPIPPEEFVIDPDATSTDDARIHGHRRNERIYNIIPMGFTYEQLKDFDEDKEELDNEKAVRKEYDEESKDDTDPSDPTAKRILFSEFYVRLDADGDGIAELRRITCGGTKYEILSDEPVNHSPFAVYISELQPHVFFPISLAEDLEQDQDAQTALLRSIIDNTALVNSPRTEVDETFVNLDDVKNNEIGAIIRTRKMGSIQELATPFVAGQTLPVLEYLDGVSEARSGITKLSQGTSSDALQSTSSAAANAAVAAADARIEMMARNIGESGLKQMFLVILRTAMYELEGEQSIRQGNEYLQVRPDIWHDQVNVRVNVGLGTGRLEEKRQVLMAMMPIQQQLVTQYGLQNPICGYDNLRNTVSDLLRLSGIRATQNYFPAVDEQILAQMDEQANAAKAAQSEEMKKAQQMQEQAVAAQGKAMMDMVKVEAQKNQLKYQTDVADLQQKQSQLIQKHSQEMQDLKAQLMEAMAKQRLELTKLYMTDDRERDKMDMTYDLETKKMGMQETEMAVNQYNTEEDRGRADSERFEAREDKYIEAERSDRNAAIERENTNKNLEADRKLNAKLKANKPKPRK